MAKQRRPEPRRTQASGAASSSTGSSRAAPAMPRSSGMGIDVITSPRLSSSLLDNTLPGGDSNYNREGGREPEKPSRQREWHIGLSEDCAKGVSAWLGFVCRVGVFVRPHSARMCSVAADSRAAAQAAATASAPAPAARRRPCGRSATT